MHIQGTIKSVVCRFSSHRQLAHTSEHTDVNVKLDNAGPKAITPLLAPYCTNPRSCPRQFSLLFTITIPSRYNLDSHVLKLSRIALRLLRALHLTLQPDLF